MKKLILPLSILIATMTACDKRVTMVSPTPAQAAEEAGVSVSASALEGTWYATEYNGRNITSRDMVVLTTMPTSPTTGTANLEIDNGSSRENEFTEYTLSRSATNNQVTQMTFKQKGGASTSLMDGGSWNISKISAQELEMQSANGTVAKFTR